MTRRLVTVRRVSLLTPIPDADLIESATVDGWTCVVAKGEHKVGELSVYFEIDSFLPALDERYSFLKVKATKHDDFEGIRIKTIKLRKVLSQGLLVPLTKFPEINAILQDLQKKCGKEDADKELQSMSFEDILGVRKWEPPVYEQGKPAGLAPFPVFVNRTDQERVQNLPNVFEEWGDAVFQESTKMDGSSMTVYFIRNDSTHISTLPTFAQQDHETLRHLPSGTVGVCSRNRDIAPDPSNHFWSVALRQNIPSKLNELNRNIAIQGELCGSSIQANFEGFQKGFHDIYVFSVWDIDAQKYLLPREVHEELVPKLGLKHVPVTGYWLLKDIATGLRDILERAEGKGINGRKREGIVLKEVRGEFSFKAISNSYLLRYGQ
ncbi:RNA ligase, DRB0094 family [Pochonia chlamydosporia 170]|uniref:RNA ligase, DRB0094 family n=1 Tax=Pochonia chlamydosporia 170 TaxID=1380566 RepID=A0A179G9V9_METCM|nr:RNA ligase, DRB0094 family [Pochonia chlamydosporia 170]OAQ73939.1 RNA ligase, DRB0094 family [Pochonia chlamydosporia 170]